MTKPTRWVLVNAAGQIEAQSGGFKRDRPRTRRTRCGATGNVYINSGEDLSDNGIAATIALENAYDLGGAGHAEQRHRRRPRLQPRVRG